MIRLEYPVTVIQLVMECLTQVMKQEQMRLQQFPVELMVQWKKIVVLEVHIRRMVCAILEPRMNKVSHGNCDSKCVHLRTKLWQRVRWRNAFSYWMWLKRGKKKHKNYYKNAFECIECHNRKMSHHNSCGNCSIFKYFKQLQMIADEQSNWIWCWLNDCNRLLYEISNSDSMQLGSLHKRWNQLHLFLVSNRTITSSVTVKIWIHHQWRVNINPTKSDEQKNWKQQQQLKQINFGILLVFVVNDNHWPPIYFYCSFICYLFLLV